MCGHSKRRPSLHTPGLQKGHQMPIQRGGGQSIELHVKEAVNNFIFSACAHYIQVPIELEVYCMGWSKTRRGLYIELLSWINLLNKKAFSVQWVQWAAIRSATHIRSTVSSCQNNYSELEEDSILDVSAKEDRKLWSSGADCNQPLCQRNHLQATSDTSTIVCGYLRNGISTVFHNMNWEEAQLPLASTGNH